MAIEKIIVQVGEEITELKGADKDAFIAQRELDLTETKTREEKIRAQKELKISAYTKLGLTEEEINAIL